MSQDFERPDDAIDAASSSEDPLTRPPDDTSSVGQALSPSRKRLVELRMRQRVPTNPSMAIPHRAGTGPASASHTQEAIWFLDRWLGPSGLYNSPMAFRLLGRIDRVALENSLQALADRHPSLRTRFEEREGILVQILNTSASIDLQVLDLARGSGAESSRDLQQILAEHAESAFNLGQAPLLRAKLFRLSPGEHVLLLVIHHIVSDGWSREIMLRELSALYTNHMEGSKSTLPSLPIDFADYAIWQRKWLSGSTLEQQVSYWKEKLAGVATLELPTDFPRPPLQSYRGARLNHPFPATVIQRLKALGQSAGTTLFMTALAAFKVLLYRYGAGSDIALGTPIAGRGRTELEGLIGFFANTLVLRTDLTGAPSFRLLLARVRDTALEAYSHQDLPFEKLVEALAPERDASRNPLFQVCFDLQTSSEAALRLPGITVEPMRLPTQHAKFDLTLSVREQDGALQASFEYCTDLFEPATIQRMAQHLQVLIESILANPDQSIDTLDLMPAPERHRILFDWNETAREYPLHLCMHELFEAQAHRTPDAVSVTLNDDQLTYRQLNERANKLAHWLGKLGVGPDMPIGVCMDRSLELVIALIGILKAGAAYMPLDPEYPAERLAFMLKDAGAPVLLTQHALRDRLPFLDNASATHVLCLDTQWDALTSQSDADQSSRCTPDDIAYVIYTSGSTGQPKGAMIPHRGLCNHIHWLNEVYRTTDQDRVLQKTSISFDASVWEFLLPLSVGATLVLAQPNGHRDTGYLVRTIREKGITILQAVPSLLQALIEEPELVRCESLRYVVSGGEPLARVLACEVQQRLPAAVLGNFYGATEASDDTTHFELREPLPGSGTVPIGRPMANAQCYVLDAHRQPVPIGVTGELYLGGAGLARGYLNRPQLTVERFVANPFYPGERLYRTGDLARYQPIGDIECIGRVDHQIKLHGFRIELGEIEAALNDCPGVSRCAVIVREDEPGVQRVVAYVVGANGPSERLFERIRARLPAYMVPSAIMPLEALPLLPNGKLDRRALPPPTANLGLVGPTYVAPRDDAERTMCRVWAEVIRVERVGLDDNFFEIGGHSLLAAKLFARLDEAFGRPLTLGTIFSAPSVRLLAEYYRNPSTTRSGATSTLVALQDGGTLPPLFAVPGVFGNVVGLATLAQALGPEQPFYGLQSLGLDGRTAPLESIEAIASRHIQDLRTKQLNGPYALVGACFGATVAYEMARQLMADGEHVAMLALLDPTAREGDASDQLIVQAPRQLHRAAAWLSLVKDRLALYWNEIRGLSVREALKFLGRKTRSVGISLIKRNALKGVERELNQREVYLANVRALDRYVRRPLKGELGTLEILETTRSGRATRTAGIEWRSYWNGMIVRHTMPGNDSGDMIAGANARVVATVLSERSRRTFDEPSVRWRKAADENRE